MYRWMCQGTATRYYRFHRCTVRIASTCQAKRVLRYVEHVHPLQYTPDTGYLDSRAFGYKDRLAAPSRLVVWELSREPVLSIRSSSCCGTMCLCMASTGIRQRGHCFIHAPLLGPALNWSPHSPWPHHRLYLYACTEYTLLLAFEQACQ
jgi:hypothetical protein